jgi:hypothetical protein
MSTTVILPNNTSIIAVDTRSVIKKIMLPPALSNPGRVLLIKDIYGSAYNNSLYISTSSGIDFIEKGSTVSQFLAYNYGSITLTNDGVNTWFYINQYYNTLSTQSQNVLLPFGFTPLIFFVGTTLSSSWTQSIGALSYSITYYYNNTNSILGSTVIQTIGGITDLFNSIYLAPNLYYYYYATVTAQNTNGSFTATSSIIQPLIFPSAPTNANLLKSGNYLYCYWVAQAYTLSYNIIFYQTSVETTIGGTIFQQFSGVRTTYYQSSIVVISGQYYYASIVAVNTSGISSNITSQSLFVGPPDIPSSLSISRTSDGTTTVSWIASKRADTYTWVLYEATTNSYTTGAVISSGIAVTSTSGTSGSYTPGYYYFTVYATNNYGTSSTAISTILYSTYSALIPVNPSSITGLQVWLDGADPNGTGVVPSSGTASTWTDKSGLSNSGSATGTITYSSTTKSMSFSGSQRFTIPNNAVPTGNNPFSYYVVFNSTTTACCNGLFGFGTFNTAQSVSLRNGGGGALHVYWYGYDYDCSINYSTNIVNQTLLTYTAGGVEAMYMNGTNGLSVTPGTRAQTSGPNYIGTTAASENWNGLIYEFLCYNVVLSSTQQQLIEGYLAWKWGSNSLLPTSHTYYSSAPGSTPIYIGSLNLVTATNVATMSWAAYSGATGYVWILYQTSNTNFTGIILAKGTTTSALTATYTGLTNGNNYYFSVYATTVSTPSVYSTSSLVSYP